MTATKDIHLPQWREDRRKPTLRTSVSQIETYELCKRKWWLERVRKLRVGQTAPQTFGDVLHGVIERFMLADHLGRDPKSGKPVDLYPEGWHIARSRFDKSQVTGEISVAEQDQIKRLVAAAIENGVLERQPGRRIEWKFNTLVTEAPCGFCDGSGSTDHPAEGCDACGGTGTVKVSIEGFIDAAYDHRVEDHKSTKSMRWAKTPAGLRESTQMMTYAKLVLMQAVKEGRTPPDKVVLRHNVYCKDPSDLKVRKVEAVVTAEEIERHWKGLVETVIEMADYRSRFDKWHEVPEPKDLSRACNAFGGCPYRPICAGVESEEGFQNRLDRIYGPEYSTSTAGVSAENVQKTEQQASTKGSAMGFDFAAKLAARKGINAAAGAAPPAPSAPALNPPTSAPAAAPAAPKATAPASNGTETPPWANPECNACKGSGFNSKGTPCRICDVKAKSLNRPQSAEFEIEYPGDGTAIWVGKNGTPTEGQAGISMLPGGGTPVAADAKASAEAKAPEPKPEPKAEPKAEPVAPAKPEPKPEPKAEPKPEPKEDAEDKGGRPKKGFALLINCGVIRGEGRVNSGRNCYHLPEVFATVAAEVAKQNGVENYYQLDPFKRRDMVSAHAEEIAAMFGADMLVCSQLSTSNPDIRAFFDAIRPFAGIEIVGGV